MTENQEQKKRHKRRFVWGVFGIFCFVLVAFSPFLLFTDTPLRISKETTYLTEPLTLDGTRIDYMRAIEERTYPPQMQTDENGYRFLIRSIGAPLQIYEDNFQEQYYAKLGLSPTHVAPLKYVDEYEFIRNYLADDPDEYDVWKEKCIEYQTAKDPSFDPDSFMQLDYFIVDDLRGHGFEPWKDWLKQVDPVLNTLAEAVRKPVFVTPYIFPPEEEATWQIQIPEQIMMRSLSKSLVHRATHRVDIGDIDGAIDDIITCRRLGRFYAKGSTMLHYLVGNGAEIRGIEMGPNANPEISMNAEQIKRLLRELDALPKFQSIENVLKTERIIGLANIDRVIHSPKKRENVEYLLNRFLELESPAFLEEINFPYFFSALGYDWNIVTKRFNVAFDQVPQKMSILHTKPPWNWMRKQYRSEELANIVIWWLLPSAQIYHQNKGEIQCRERIQRLVLAMLLYEKEHSTLPPAFTVDANGKPLHSWRVLLLPYLDSAEKKLYENIRLDEPWDSDWNHQFHETQIAAYTCPGSKEPKGQCHDYVIVGDDTPFASQPKFDAESGKTVGRRSSDFEANTIFVLEFKKATCWMDPMRETLQVDVDAAASRGSSSPYLIPGIHGGSLFIGCKSGAIHTISETLQIETFQKLMRGTMENLP